MPPEQQIESIPESQQTFVEPEQAASVRQTTELVASQQLQEQTVEPEAPLLEEGEVIELTPGETVDPVPAELEEGQVTEDLADEPFPLEPPQIEDVLRVEPVEIQAEIGTGLRDEEQLAPEEGEIQEELPPMQPALLEQPEQGEIAVDEAAMMAEEDKPEPKTVDEIPTILPADEQPIIEAAPVQAPAAIVK